PWSRRSGPAPSWWLRPRPATRPVDAPAPPRAPRAGDRPRASGVTAPTRSAIGSRGRAPWRPRTGRALDRIRHRGQPDLDEGGVRVEHRSDPVGLRLAVAAPALLQPEHVRPLGTHDRQKARLPLAPVAAEAPPDVPGHEPHGV